MYLNNSQLFLQDLLGKHLKIIANNQYLNFRKSLPDLYLQMESFLFCHNYIQECHQTAPLQLCTLTLFFKSTHQLPCINGKRYTRTVNHTNPIFYLAKWEESVLGGLPDDSNCVSTIVYDFLVRPLIIHYIAVHHCSDLEQSYKYTVACVSWVRKYRDVFYFGKPLQSWYYNYFVSGGTHTFIPVELLHDLCIYSTKNSNDGKLLLLLPCH